MGRGPCRCEEGRGWGSYCACDKPSGGCGSSGGGGDPGRAQSAIAAPLRVPLRRRKRQQHLWSTNASLSTNSKNTGWGSIYISKAQTRCPGLAQHVCRWRWAIAFHPTHQIL